MFKELVQSGGVPQTQQTQNQGVNIGGGTKNTYNTYINTGKKTHNTSTPKEHVCIASSYSYCDDYCPQCVARGYTYTDDSDIDDDSTKASSLFIEILKEILSIVITPATPKAIALPQTIEAEVTEIVKTTKPKKEDNILEEWANMQDDIKVSREQAEWRLQEIERQRKQRREENTLDAWKAREEEKASKANFKSLLDNPENFKHLRKVG